MLYQCKTDVAQISTGKLGYLENAARRKGIFNEGSVLTEIILKMNSFFLYKIIYLFFYFWLRWVFVAACRLSLVAESGGYSSLWCVGFSLRWLLLLQSTGSRRTSFSSCSSQAPEHRLRSCGARA